MPPPQEDTFSSLLLRTDFAKLDVPLAKLCTWIGDGWLEQVGTAPTADGSTGEPVYAIISRQLRTELLPKLQQIGKAAAALTPMRARSQLLRLMLARKGILLPFDGDDDVVSVKTKLIEELAAGLLGPDLAQALEDAASDLEREVEAALGDLGVEALPALFGGDGDAVVDVGGGDQDPGAATPPQLPSTMVDEPAEIVEPADLDPPLVDATADPIAAVELEALAELAGADGMAASLDPDDTETVSEADLLLQADETAGATDVATPGEMADAPDAAEVAEAEEDDHGQPGVPDREAWSAATDEEAEWFDTGDLLDETSFWDDDDDPLLGPPRLASTEEPAAMATSTESEDGLPEGDRLREEASAAEPLGVAQTDSAATGDPEPDTGEASTAAAAQGAEGDAADHAEPADASSDVAEDAEVAEEAEVAVPKVVVLAQTPAPVAADAAASPADGEAAKDEHITEAELASLAGSANLLDFGVTFRDGLTEEEVSERLVPQVAMTITDTLVAMLGDDQAPLAGAVQQQAGARVDLQPLTAELAALRQAVQQLADRRAAPADAAAAAAADPGLADEIGRLRGALQALAERPAAAVDFGPLQQELSRLCALVELLADRRGDPPGVQKIASALELGFARIAGGPTELAMGIKAAGKDVVAALREGRVQAQAAPTPAPVLLPRRPGLLPAAAIAVLLLCWTAVLYVKSGDARLALGALLAVSMVGSTVVAFRRD